MITGSLVAIVTPMKSGKEQDGALDLERFKQLID
jgi:dihydrodipicolinate synthase/N-acetylneuraminate lyase